MTGRGIDLVLPHSVDPTLHEPWVKSAVAYVRIAEEASGPIPSEVEYAYVWGDSLQVLEAYRSELRPMYLPRIDHRSGRLLGLEMAPMEVRRFRLHRASDEASGWLAQTLDRESPTLGARVERRSDNTLALSWESPA
jgi:poly-gamma-glutamate capsule biosynthesis protein CapA/YwtB (metallophosphatase superfamily)